MRMRFLVTQLLDQLLKALLNGEAQLIAGTLLQKIHFLRRPGEAAPSGSLTLFFKSTMKK